MFGLFNPRSLVELGLEPTGYLAQGIASRPEFYGDRARQFTSVGSWMLPNLKTIRNLQPDSILGWVFPHRFYQRWLQQIAPTYLMGDSGYSIALARLRDIARLTERVKEAETAIQQLETQIDTYRAAIPANSKKAVLMMGGSTLNFLSRRFIIETKCWNDGWLTATAYPLSLD